MRVFDKGSWTGDITCPVCNTQKEGKVVLIPTEEGIASGEMTIEAHQVHLDCLLEHARIVEVEDNKYIIVPM